MKRRICFVLCLVLVLAVVMSACSQQNTQSNPSESAAVSQAAESTAASSSQTASQPAASNSKPLKVVLLVNANLGDMGFFDSAASGMEQMKKELGAETKVVETGPDQSKWEPALQDLSEQDWDVIICGTYQMIEPLQKIAPEYPDKKYILFDSAVDYSKGNLSNVYSLSYKYNEASFLFGAFAAKVSASDMKQVKKNNLVGFIGGQDVPLINDFMVGYVQGAQYVNPNIKVAISYIGDWQNSAKGKEMALAQYDQGTDIIMAAAGQAGLGLFEAGKEKNKYSIGMTTDSALLFKDSDPEKANLILTSLVADVGKSLVQAVKKYSERTLKFGAAEEAGVTSGIFSLVKNDIYEKEVSDEVKTYMADLEKKMTTGEITVDTAYGKDNTWIENFRNKVKP